MIEGATNLGAYAPYRDIAQLGRALPWGGRGHRFDSCYFDHKDTYSNPSIRRLWVQIPWKAPLAFLAEMVYAFDLKSNYSILCLVNIGV